MAELDANLNLYSPAELAGNYRGDLYSSAVPLRVASPDNRFRFTKEHSEIINTAPGIVGGWTPAGSRTAEVMQTIRAAISGIYRGKQYPAKISLTPGMYTERDRIPRIGVHQTLTGYGIPDTEVLISGKLGITTAAKTDGRGIWWAYLPADDYSNAEVRSFGGGYVYKMMEQTEREEGYIWDEIMKRVTPTGAGYRMIYRFV